MTTHHLNGSCLIFTAAGGHVGTVDFQGRRPVLGISHGGQEVQKWAVILGLGPWYIGFDFF